MTNAGDMYLHQENKPEGPTSCDRSLVPRGKRQNLKFSFTKTWVLQGHVTEIDVFLQIRAIPVLFLWKIHGWPTQY